jgi:hypothetical protein
MEILRFEDTESPAPKRKHRSKGLVALGLVAALMGIGTAFASSTITVNGNNQVNLGQGVVTVSGCDSNIGFKPETKLSPDATKFQVTDFIIGFDYDGSGKGLVDTTACAGQLFKVTLYKDNASTHVPELVKCETTYDGSPAAGAALRGTTPMQVIIGGRNDNSLMANNAVPYKCSSDGSFYYEASYTPSPPLINYQYTSAKIYWPDKTGFIFDANWFDHVTIESVSGETGLSGATV